MAPHWAPLAVRLRVKSLPDLRDGGAAYGALVGAALGAYEGCSRAGTCWGQARDQGYRRYDRYSDRYYYEDPCYGDSYWDDGQFRRYGPRGYRGRGDYCG
ncbi:MAG: hypothetical protein R3C40_08455 [Parvularculaceae bacterium]